MQKVASAGMGNPKERKECPICGKTLYDRSTWNRHMRIHTGKFRKKRHHFSCNDEIKIIWTKMLFIANIFSTLLQVKNLIHANFVEDVSEPITINLGMKRNVQTDMLMILLTAKVWTTAAKVMNTTVNPLKRSCLILITKLYLYHRVRGVEVLEELLPILIPDLSHQLHLHQPHKQLNTDKKVYIQSTRLKSCIKRKNVC